MNDNDLLTKILDREGSEYTERPGDPPTKYGITLETLSKSFGRPASKDELKALTEWNARQILEAMYLRPFAEIPNDVLREALIDFGVNSSPERAIRYLQRVLGLKVDSILGPVTLHAALLKTGPWLAAKLNLARLRMMAADARTNPNKLVALPGWVNRVADLLEATL